VVIERAAQLAELERASVRRAVLESRLKVIQARVEPELLFEVLADVQRLYGRAPRDAEALLDDLIVYLRAALPQMRGDASTLGREAELACALLKLTEAGRDRSLNCVNRIGPELAELPFPPMVLLPLAQEAANAHATRVVFDASIVEEGNEAGVAVRITVEVPSGAPVRVGKTNG
jgi:LytS/YehU family sensor histidine kinase